MPNPQTIKVRIPIVRGPSGSLIGHWTDQCSEAGLFRYLAVLVPDGEVVAFVEAELPLPTIPTVQGTVEVAQ
jgi:hypothetical protein